jgi:hypothetical protein
MSGRTVLGWKIIKRNATAKVGAFTFETIQPEKEGRRTSAMSKADGGFFCQPFVLRMHAAALFPASGSAEVVVIALLIPGGREPIGTERTSTLRLQ